LWWAPIKVGAVDLWTQRLRISFRQTLRFYERRFEIVRHFEELGTLRDFRVHAEDRVALRLGDANHRVGFGPAELDAALFIPGGDIGRVEDAFVYAGDQLEAQRMVRPQITFQWLEEIVGLSYDEARRAAARSVFKPKSLNDFALLIDGRLDAPALTFQAEVGVVDAAEIPTRLSGSRSGVVAADQEAPPTLWSDERLPEVAIYGGLGGFLDEKPSSTNEVIDLWRTTRDATEQLMLELMDALQLPKAADE
jgi:hypothetical protein